MNRKRRYRWYETVSCFMVEDTKTGDERCMGDGVDLFHTKTGKAIPVATKAFYREMGALFEDQRSIGEAYFGN